mgnify:CR=1
MKVTGFLLHFICLLVSCIRIGFIICTEIISMDMRQWKAPCLADIMVSELLGSWGDNEVSPGEIEATMPVLVLDKHCLIEREKDFLCPVILCPVSWVLE